MDFPQLLGSFNTMFSVKADCQRAMNVRLERVNAGRNQFVMYRNHGLTAGRFLGGACRGLLELNDVLFAVMGSIVYALDSGLNTILATPGLDANSDPVSIAASPNSLFIVSHGVLYRRNSGALTMPATDFIPTAVVTIGGLVVGLDSARRRIYWSTDDGVTWPALNFQTVEVGPPNALVNMIVDHEELWIFGNRCAVVYVLGDDPDAPFIQVRAGIIMMGLESFAGLVALDNSLFWLGRNKDGDLIVSRANGYSPVRVSTDAIESAFRSYDSHGDAVMQAFQLSHPCFRITFPSANNGLGASWEYDVATNEWTELSYRNFRLDLIERHRGQMYVSAFGRIVVGDYANGWLYELSPDAFTDFGYPIRWFRRAPHLTKDGKWIRYLRFEVFPQVGFALTTPLWLQAYSLQPADFVAALAGAVAGGDVTAAQALILQDIYDVAPYIPLNPYPTADVMSALGFYPWGAVATLTNGTVLGSPPRLGMRYWNNGAVDEATPYRYKSLGNTADYHTRLFWLRLGRGRDRVWEIGGDDPAILAVVQGAFDAEVADT